MPLDQYWDKDAYDEQGEDGNEMSFIDHLEELRWHIIRALAAIGVFTIAAFIFHKEIFHYIIFAPKDPNFWTYRQMCNLAQLVHAPDLCVTKIDFTLMSREMTGQFMMAMTYSLIIGLIFAFPYAFWELWRFIKPGLHQTEIRASRGAVFWVTFLFLLGVLFGYYIVSPLAINFLANFKIDESIANQFDIDSYISLLAMMVLACGLTFQLPMVTYVLSQVGILTPAFMREYRKHAFIVMLIIAAIITPSPDIFSQLLVTAPLLLLYEVSIWVSARVNARKQKELAA
ncbi:MAG: twin-arginine translocase subunit TatC [Siphonobacter sp.]